MKKERNEKLKSELVKVGKMIVKNRLDAKMTQERLNRESDLPVGYLSKIEIGKVNCTIKTLATLAEALDLELSIEFNPKE